MTTDTNLFSNDSMEIATLHKRSEAVASNVILKSKKQMDVIELAVALLENFEFQARKLDKLGYCDYAIAYVSYQACLLATKYCSETSLNSVNSIVNRLSEALRARENKLISIEKYLRNHSLSGGKSINSDEIGDRFRSLMGSLSSSTARQMMSTPAVLASSLILSPELDLLKYTDFISSEQLNVILRRYPQSILLIDFRTEKEFAYSHINFLNVLNIPPKLVSNLILEKPDAKDLDLESALAASVLSTMLALFQDRHKFDLVVIYNLRYGPVSVNKFDSLEFAAEKSTLVKNSPFQKLIELLVWRNQYISSKLKQYPLILAGGMKVWHNLFGQEGLISLSLEISESESAGLTTLKTTTSLPESKYVRKFNDYLSAGTRSGDRANNVLVNSASNHNYSHQNSHQNKYQNHQNHQNNTALSKSQSFQSGEISSSQRVPNGFTFGFHPERERSSIQALSIASTKPAYPAPAAVTNKSNDSFQGLTTGLTNLGNSCYMNCILQCLVATPPLTKFFFQTSKQNVLEITQFKDHINLTNRLGTKGAVTITLVNLITNMLKNLGRYYTPSDFKKIIGNFSPGRQFATSEQQDCIEFLNFILDSVHEDLNKVKFESAQDRAKLLELSPEEEKNKEQLPVRLASTIEWERYLALNLSVVVDYFQGQYLSRLKCLVCSLTSTTYNSFSILSLPIPERLGNLTKKVSLFDCLDFFTETELLEDDNKWHCPSCKTFTRLTKKIVITRLPNILIIHFKRFSQSGGRFKKLDTFIDYPVDTALDLTSYWPNIATYLDPPKNEFLGGMDANLEKEYLSSLPERNQVAPFKYKLYGVVNHFGNLTTGHYTSYVHKKGKGGNGWYYFDDSKFTPNCKVEKVLNSNAYCLFYQRV